MCIIIIQLILQYSINWMTIKILIIIIIIYTYIHMHIHIYITSFHCKYVYVCIVHVLHTYIHICIYYNNNNKLMIFYACGTCPTTSNL